MASRKKKKKIRQYIRFNISMADEDPFFMYSYSVSKQNHYTTRIWGCQRKRECCQKIPLHPDVSDANVLLFAAFPYI